jgi:hypothetical protein
MSGFGWKPRLSTSLKPHKNTGTQEKKRPTQDAVRRIETGAAGVAGVARFRQLRLGEIKPQRSGQSPLKNWARLLVTFLKGL